MAKELSIVETVASATEADLEAIDARLETLRNGELAKINREISALVSLRKVISIKLHGKAARKKPEKKTPAASPSAPASSNINDFSRRRQIAKAIGKGALPPGGIASQTTIAEREVRLLTMSHPWFEVLADGRVKMTRLGAEECKDG